MASFFARASRRFRALLFVAITAVVSSIPSVAAEFGSPDICCQSGRDNVLISTNWDTDGGTILAENPFTVTFYRLTSISTTDVKPYIVDADSQTRHYFRDVVCSGNRLTLSNPDFGTDLHSALFEHFFLVIPAGSVSADDGTVNETEYRRGFMKLAIHLTPHIIDGRIVDYYAVEGEGADFNPDVHITMFSPSDEQIEFFGGHAMSFDFHDQGSYSMFATINVDFTDADGTRYVGRTNTYGSIELAGISSEFQLAKVTDSSERVTKLVATFPQNEAMAINHRRAAEYPYIENGDGQRIYFDSHCFAGNELELTLCTPLSENGNYRLVIPEQYVYHLFESGAIAVPNKYEVSQNFNVGDASGDASIAVRNADTAAHFDIYDIHGAKVAAGVDRINPTAGLAPGIYILTDGCATYKLRIP